MGQNIVIYYEHRHGMLKGTDVFNAELQKEFTVFQKPKWMPAAGGNYEMWFEIFINSPFFNFLSSAIVGGMLWDITKHAFLNTFSKSLETLSKTNNDQLDIFKYTFNFEDTTIVINAVTKNFTVIFNEIFNELFKQFPVLKSKKETALIYEIHIPVDPENPHQSLFGGSKDPQEYIKCWKILTELGLYQYLYFPSSKKIKKLF